MADTSFWGAPVTCFARPCHSFAGRRKSSRVEFLCFYRLLDPFCFNGQRPVQISVLFLREMSVFSLCAKWRIFVCARRGQSVLSLAPVFTMGRGPSLRWQVARRAESRTAWHSAHGQSVAALTDPTWSLERVTLVLVKRNLRFRRQSLFIGLFRPVLFAHVHTLV